MAVTDNVIIEQEICACAERVRVTSAAIGTARVQRDRAQTALDTAEYELKKAFDDYRYAREALVRAATGKAEEETSLWSRP